MVTRLYGVEGATVLAVRPNSPAAAAGLRGARKDAEGRILPGDIIVAVGDRKVRTSQDFFAALQRQNPGMVVTIRVVRDAAGERQTVDVPLRLEAEP
jgi:S1-C subfamily serine protease